MQDDLPSIKDNFDVESAEEIVFLGYPRNAEALEELLFWSCFPNDPVCWPAFPYVSTLRDEALAPALARFLTFHLKHQQIDLIRDAFWLFINDRGEGFRARILSHMEDEAARALFRLPEYSLEEHARERERFERIQREGHPFLLTAEQVQERQGKRPSIAIGDERDMEGAKKLVAVGHPENADALDQAIFFACFPDKPVSEILLPYLSALRDEVLAPALAEFIENCREQGHGDLIARAFELFITERGPSFCALIASHMSDDGAKALLQLQESNAS